MVLHLTGYCKTSAGDVYYIDTANIKQHNGFVYYWELIDLPEPFKGSISIITKKKTDCGEEKTKNIDSTAYSQAMGKGREILKKVVVMIFIIPNQIQLDIIQCTEYVR